jgi:ribosomal protein L11 methyltransferase
LDRKFPALDIDTTEHDLLLAIVDDFSPTAVEDRDHILRVFFSSSSARDAARAALAQRYTVHAVDVSDEDWARRSQENLQPVTVGRITIVSTAGLKACATEIQRPAPDSQPLTIVIEPSMGFGTGHHATTRLCLAALQQMDLLGQTVFDVGTGSGVLAIAADRLGASWAIGVDADPDAIQSARENLGLNLEAQRVRFDVADLESARLPSADVVVANLTGALLVRAAARLLEAVKPGGALIVSGLQTHEREDVARALASADLFWQAEEEGWIALAMKKS